MDSGPSSREDPFAVDLVKGFLRGQNLEQLGRVDEAIEHYEYAVAADFDSPGPYDRLIEIYSQRALHLEVVRVAGAALGAVHTHPDKYQWYESMADAATRAATKVPAAAPKKPAG
jgi:tetratricopeptide (TPR) repeat protein